MGRASSMASCPPSGRTVGSLAPIENSPPGIQFMPAGGLPGAAVLFCIVGRNTFREETSGTDAGAGFWNGVPRPQTAAAPGRTAAVTSARYRSSRVNLFTLYTLISQPHGVAQCYARPVMD